MNTGNRWVTAARIVGVSFAGAALNVVVAVAFSQVLVPLYLDSVFTVLVVLLFGPLAGFLTAAMTNVTLEILGRVHIVFLLCHMLTVGVVWGYRHIYGPDPHFNRYLGMGLVAGFGNGVLGSFLSLWVFGGLVRYHTIDHITEGLLIAGQDIYRAVFSAGMLTNLIDKSISVIIVYVLLLRVAHIRKFKSDAMHEQ